MAVCAVATSSEDIHQYQTWSFALSHLLFPTSKTLKVWRKAAITSSKIRPSMRKFIRPKLMCSASVGLPPAAGSKSKALSSAILSVFWSMLRMRASVASACWAAWLPTLTWDPSWVFILWYWAVVGVERLKSEKCEGWWVARPLELNLLRSCFCALTKCATSLWKVKQPNRSCLGFTRLPWFCTTTQKIFRVY